MYATVSDIQKFLETIAPKELAEGWDNTGLAIGNPKQEVKKILVALDVIDPVIDEAIAEKADMILTHHPLLLFQKINSITADTPLGSKIFRLIQHQITAFSAHTNLDVAKGGTNDVLAELAGLRDVEILEETWAESLKKLVVYVPVEQAEVLREAMGNAGAGHIGKYSHCTFETEGVGTFLPLEGANPFLGEQGKLERAREVRLESIVPEAKLDQVRKAMLQAHPYEEVAYDVYPVEQKGRREGIGRIGNLPQEMTFHDFAARLKERLGLDALRLVGDPVQKIKRVGLCTGSGVEFMAAAKKRGADAYLTGDIKYHEAQKAVEMCLCVADVTHYASEVIIVPVLAEIIREAAREHGWMLDVVCSKTNGQTFWHI